MRSELGALARSGATYTNLMVRSAAKLRVSNHGRTRILNAIVAAAVMTG
jgi:hypothetical protein